MSLPGVKFHGGWPVQRDNHPPPPGFRRPGPGFTLRRIRLRWRGWTALATATALLSAAIVLAELAARYQPLSYGSTGHANEYFRGLPTGKGIHVVNTVGGIHEDIYIPPQRGTFSVFLDLENNGPRPVIIEAVTVQRDLALWQAGPVRYAWQGQAHPITKPHMLRHVRLGPGQDVFVGIPVRTWSCVSKGTWTSVPFAYVTERFGPFTHRVPIPWGMQDDQLVLHFPGGAEATFCAS